MSFDRIQKNLNDIERKLGKSNKIVAKGQDIKLGDAIKIGSKSRSIVSTIKKGIKDYQAFTPNEDEAKTIIKQMNVIVELTETQLGLLTQHQSRFESLHVGGMKPLTFHASRIFDFERLIWYTGLVKKNMEKSDEAGSELSAIMLAKAPDSIKAESEALDARRVAAFKKATSAFANSKGGEDQADGAEDSD
jgi:hypothetical protein